MKNRKLNELEICGILNSIGIIMNIIEEKLVQQFHTRTDLELEECVADLKCIREVTHFLVKTLRENRNDI